MKRILTIFITLLVFSVVLPSCETKSQCKRYKKKQKKRMKMSENIIIKNDLYVEFIKLKKNEN
jgi:uncharacterized membrane protein